MARRVTKAEAVKMVTTLRDVLQSGGRTESAAQRATRTSSIVFSRVFGPHSDYVTAIPESMHAMSTRIETCLGLALAALDEITLLWEEEPNTMNTQDPVSDPALVFVIHGRQRRSDMHDFLRAIGLKPLEWSQVRRYVGNPNPYTWEIVDLALRKAGAIVALMTPDDEARLREDLWGRDDNALEKTYLHQARQNVLFEAGVAYGRNPERTVLVRVGSHRPMSDLAGHHILHLTNSPESRQAVADALRAAGCPVDLSGADWYRAGNFD